MSTEELAPNVFISHINEEKGIAHVIQHYIQRAFGPEFRVFVSSDQTSIGGGRAWFEYILRNLKKAQVVLVLLSDESRTREWINFEAGVGAGASATVIPVAIRQFNLTRLGFPLKGYQARLSGEIEGIISDVRRVCEMPASQVDRVEYEEKLQKAEDQVTYKSVILRPFLESTGSSHGLRFEIRNQGNTDIDLLHVDVLIPVEVCSKNWSPPRLGPRDVGKEQIDERSYYRLRLTALTNDNGRLEPVLTRSMGWVQLQLLDCPLDESNPNLGTDQTPIHFQVHARNYDTKVERVTIEALPRQSAAVDATA